MIPAWKARRELLRVVEQLKTLPLRLKDPALRKRYDQTRWDQIQVRGSAAPVSEKYCVLLVYQPAELPPSLVVTCDFMAAKGYNVLVVANGGLRPAAAEALEGHVWRLLERPNFGYDFGGYRDAIHFLDRSGILPQLLILLNDSIWFPVSTKSRVVERLEGSALDVTGLLMHQPGRNDGPGKSGRRDRRAKSEFVESYLFALPRRTYSHPAFRRYWQDYPQTTLKSLTIKRGEIGFSKAMRAAGLSIGALSGRREFIAALEDRPTGFLEQTLRYAAYSDAEFDTEAQALKAMPKDLDWPARARSHVARVVRRRRFNASFVWASEQIFDTAFIKKHKGRLFQLSRVQFLKAVEAGDLDCDNEAALSELRQQLVREALPTASKVEA